MRQVAVFVLITAGTIGATFGIAKTDPNVDNWATAVQIDRWLTGVSLLVLAAGIALRYVGRHKPETVETGAGASLSLFNESMAAVIAAVKVLEQREANGSAHEDAGTELEALHRELDDIIEGPVTAVIENRQALADAFGMTEFATVMSSFAQGERYLNRAWSAAVDGYLQESRDSIRNAQPALQEACDESARLG